MDLLLDIFLLARSSEHDLPDIVLLYDAGDIEIHHLIVEDVADRENDVAARDGVCESDIFRASIDTEDSFCFAMIRLHYFFKKIK